MSVNDKIDKYTNIDTYYNNNNDVKQIPFPYKISHVDYETNKELLNYFKGEKSHFVQVGPQKWVLPSGYAQDAETYYNFQARPDDVWIVTFPRSGTTWTQEMVWLLANNLDYKTATSMPLSQRFPFLEFGTFLHPAIKAELMHDNRDSLDKLKDIERISQPVWKYLAGLEQKRFIKTHLPFDLLPPNLLQVGCKVIYIARNPKDVCVSYYHLNRLFRTLDYKGTFPQYWDYFEKNLLSWTPYWEHIKEGWTRRHESNVLFMFYEDLNKNLRTSIERVSNFLGGKQYSANEFDTLAQHLNIETFRNNKSVNFDELKQLGVLLPRNNESSFIRRGSNGGWRDYFSDELNAKADKWIGENLKDTDLRFPLINNVN